MAASCALSRPAFFGTSIPAQKQVILSPGRPRVRVLAAALQTDNATKDKASLTESVQIEQLMSAKAQPGRRSIVNRMTAAATVAALCVGANERKKARAAAASTCQVSSSSLGIEYCDAFVGEGEPVKKGMTIKAHYTGRLTTGAVFDSSYKRGKPLVFRIGVGEVIKGWDQGILGGAEVPPMRTGGKRTLRIPPELGYGARGAGCRGGQCVIPPDSALIFDVELVGFV